MKYILNSQLKFIKNTIRAIGENLLFSISNFLIMISVMSFSKTEVFVFYSILISYNPIFYALINSFFTENTIVGFIKDTSKFNYKIGADIFLIIFFGLTLMLFFSFFFQINIYYTILIIIFSLLNYFKKILYALKESKIILLTSIVYLFLSVLFSIYIYINSEMDIISLIRIHSIILFLMLMIFFIKINLTFSLKHSLSFSNLVYNFNNFGLVNLTSRQLLRLPVPLFFSYMATINIGDTAILRGILTLTTPIGIISAGFSNVYFPKLVVETYQPILKRLKPLVLVCLCIFSLIFSLIFIFSFFNEHFSIPKVGNENYYLLYPAILILFFSSIRSFISDIAKSSLNHVIELKSNLFLLFFDISIGLYLFSTNYLSLILIYLGFRMFISSILIIYQINNKE